MSIYNIISPIEPSQNNEITFGTTSTNPTNNKVPPPSVPRPDGYTQSAAVIERAFSGDYWMQRTGDWQAHFPLPNVIASIQSICEEVFDRIEGQMVKPFPYAKQGTSFKNTAYERFLDLARTGVMEEGYRSLILDMIEATDNPNSKNSTGRRWLFEHCMRRVGENRRSRVRPKARTIRNRHRGIVSFGSGSSGSTSK